MIPSRSLPVFTIAFAAAYAVIYIFAIEFNLALFTYHPASEEFYFLVKPAADQPAMYWYGWLATAALGAFVVAALASGLPESWSKRISPGWSWMVPVAMMLFVVYVLRGYFLRP
jgi:hypothetical protein